VTNVQIYLAVAPFILVALVAAAAWWWVRH